MNAKQRRSQARRWYRYHGDKIDTGTMFRYPITPDGLASARRELAMLQDLAPRSLTTASVARVVVMLAARLA